MLISVAPRRNYSGAASSDFAPQSAQQEESMQSKSLLGASALALLLAVGPALAADTINVLVEAGGESLQKPIAE